MPIANLRALQTVIANAIDDIERIYGEESKASGLALDFPSLEEPYYKHLEHTPAEDKSIKLSEDKRVLAASAMIVAAAGQITATVHKPWFSIVDCVKTGHYGVSLYYFERANIVEILREAGPEGAHVDDIARRVDEIRPDTGNQQGPTDPRHISHILRLLATYHWVNEIKPDVFSNNRLSSFLDTGKSTEQIKASPETKYDETDGSSAYIGAISDIHNAAVKLPEWVLTGGYGKEGKKKWASPFNLMYETDLVFYEWLELPENKAEHLSRFGHAMNGSRYWEELQNMVDGFPWAELPKDALVVDVGGGIGSASMVISKAFPDLRFVIQDRPEVIALARPSWGPAYNEVFEKGRLTFQVHDIFTPQVPVEIAGLGKVSTAAHVFILRFIVHNWTDPDVIKLLKALRKNAAPHTRLLIVDIVPTHACPDDPLAGTGLDSSSEQAVASARSFAPESSPVLANLGKANANGYLLDISMMTLFDARERTFRELSQVAGAAGWKLTGVRAAVGSLWGYVTAEPV